MQADARWPHVKPPAGPGGRPGEHGARPAGRGRPASRSLSWAQEVPMPEASAACPYCGKPISPVPRRARLCPHCRRKVAPRGGKLLPAEQAAGAQPPPAPAAPPTPAPTAPAADAPAAAAPAAGDLRQVIAEVLQQLGAAPETTERFARWQAFGSDLS